MRKLTAYILVLVCFLTLTGCKPSQNQGTTAPTSTGGTTATTGTAAPLTTGIPTTTAPDPATFIEVWPSTSHGYEGFDDYLPCVNGISLHKDLDAAMQIFLDPHYVFPLVVTVSLKEATKEEIYEAIFKPYIAYDELKSEGGQYYKVFLTAEQIADMKCPDGVYADIQMEMWTEKAIWEDNVDEITAPTKHVKVEVACTYGHNPEENKALATKAVDEIFADHGITEDMVSYRSSYSAVFKAVLDKDIIAGLVVDPRIEWIMDIDHEGSDYVLVDRASGTVEYVYDVFDVYE